MKLKNKNAQKLTGEFVLQKKRIGGGGLYKRENLFKPQIGHYPCSGSALLLGFSNIINQINHKTKQKNHA